MHVNAYVRRGKYRQRARDIVSEPAACIRRAAILYRITITRAIALHLRPAAEAAGEVLAYPRFYVARGVSATALHLLARATISSIDRVKSLRCYMQLHCMCIADALEAPL